MINTESDYCDRDGHVLKEWEKEELAYHYFADSYLIRFEMKDGKKEGKFFFCNITSFAASEEVAEAVNLIITFKEITSLQFRGYYDFEFLRGARVYADRFEKTSDGRYRFSFLCIVNYEYFIIEITFSELAVKYFESDWGTAELNG